MVTPRKQLDARTLRWVVRRLRADARKYATWKTEAAKKWADECSWQAKEFLAKAREVERGEGK